MGIRPARCIRDMKKVAWTRFSRTKPRKSYIKAMPHQDLQVFRMGMNKSDFDMHVDLQTVEDVVLRDNAIEAARQSTNKFLEKSIPGNYYLIVKVFPHHVIRENKMIAGAGADRLQKGMRQSFGRPTDKAARVAAGTAVFTVSTYKQNLEVIKEALGRAKKKLSGRYKLTS